jgi:hypothetical protein
MNLDDWILALHLLSAFALVGALTMFSIGLVALRSTDTPGRVLAVDSTMRIGTVTVAVGAIGTILFGLWLAISLDAYSIWDLWVLLAIVGWALATEIGRRSGMMLREPFQRARELVAQGKDGPDPELNAALRSSPAHKLHWVAVTITLLVLIDMIWKPGA